MPKLKVIDIDNKTSQEKDIPNSIGVDTVYVNTKTRKLDIEYQKHLSKSFSPIPLGSCYAEGDYVLPIFAGAANKLGFYFGVEEECLPEQTIRNLGKCQEEGDIEIVDFESKKIVIPVGFK